MCQKAYEFRGDVVTKGALRCPYIPGEVERLPRNHQSRSG